MAKWTMVLNKYCKDKEVELKDIRKTYAFALYSSIVKKTPVGNPDFDKDSGRARGNWQVTVGAPAEGEVKDRRKTPKPISSMPEPKGDESIFITNNVPYITTLEYGGYPTPVKKGSRTRKEIKPPRYEIMSEGGYSKQAPEGMVGVTLANNKNIFDSAVRAVKGRSK